MSSGYCEHVDFACVSRMRVWDGNTRGTTTAYARAREFLSILEQRCRTSSPIFGGQAGLVWLRRGQVHAEGKGLQFQTSLIAPKCCRTVTCSAGSEGSLWSGRQDGRLTGIDQQSCKIDHRERLIMSFESATCRPITSEPIDFVAEASAATI